MTDYAARPVAAAYTGRPGLPRSGAAVREPALAFIIYLETRPQIDGDVDPRRSILNELKAFLQERDAAASDNSRLDALNLDAIARSRSDTDIYRLEQPAEQNPSTGKEDFYCWVYTLDDTVVIEIAIGLVGDEDYRLDDAYIALRGRMPGSVVEGSFDRSDPGIIGASSFFWAIASERTAPKLYDAPVRELLAKSADDSCIVREASTDLGSLWQADVARKPATESNGQDFWILVTGDEKEVQKEVQDRYLDPRSTFVRTALARHKFESYSLECDRHRAEIEDWQNSVDRQTRDLVEGIERLLRRPLDPRSGESTPTTSFERLLSSSARELAAYRNQASRLQGIRRTLAIARRNFLINGVTLISHEGELRVHRSDSQEAEALLFLRGWQAAGRDDLFRGEIGRMRAHRDQLDADIDYSNHVVERANAALDSGLALLQVAGQRQLRGVVHHLSIDSAGVIASLVVVLVTTDGALKGIVDPIRGLVVTISLAGATFFAVAGMPRLHLSQRWLAIGAMLLALASVVAVVGVHVDAIKYRPTSADWWPVLAFIVLVSVVAARIGLVPVARGHITPDE